MDTVILYNIISLITIVILSFALRFIKKSNFDKKKQVIAKVVTTIVLICVTAFILFIDAIAVGIIGLAPN